MPQLREPTKSARGSRPSVVSHHPSREEDKVRRRRGGSPTGTTTRAASQLAFRFKDLLKYTGLKKTQLREMIKAGEFPRGVHVSANSRTLVWFEGALIAWQAESETGGRHEQHSRQSTSIGLSACTRDCAGTGMNG